MKLHLPFWSALLLLAVPSPAAEMVDPARAERINLRPYLEVLEDAGGSLTLEDVRRRNTEFKPIPGHGEDINFGYSASAYWLKIILDNRKRRVPGEWLLEAGFPTLDSVTLYVPDEHGIWRTFNTGDKLPFSGRPFRHRNFVFPLTLPAERTVPVYLRIVSEGSLTIPLTLWSESAFYNESQDAYAAFSIYYGMLLALGLYNFLLFISLRDRTFLAYVAFVGCMAIGQLSLNGMGNQYLWPEWPGWGHAAYSSGFAATGFFAAIFTRLFLRTRQTVPRLDRIIGWLIAGFAFAALSPAFMSYRWAAILTSLLGVSFSAIAVIAGVVCLHRRHAGARWFLLAWTLLLLGVAVMGLRNLGWIPTSTLTTYAMQIGSALEMLLLSFALADRIHIALHEKELAQAEALSVKEQMLQNLRETERLLEERVELRTEELAQANIRLQESEKHLRHLATHDQLTGLANRRLLDEHFDHALALSRRHGRQLAVLLIDLDDFKQVNDTHGHAVGDELLVIIARRLLEQVRDADIVARLGGDEFVLLFEQIREQADIESRISALAALLNEPCMTSAGPLRVGASIGRAFYPRDGDSTKALLKQADQSMYEAKTTRAVPGALSP